MRRAVAAMKRVGLLVFLVPLVVSAASALSYYSYRYARDLARRGEQSILDTNRDLAEGLVRRVEQVVIESDRALFDLVDLEKLHEFPRRWSDIVRLSQTIESAVILDDDLDIVPDGYVSKKRSKEEVEAFRELFERELAGSLEIAGLAEGEHKHLHREVEGRYYLLSYTRRRAMDRDFFIVLEGDLAFLVADVFPDAFSGVDARRLYQVVDEHDQLVFGHPFAQIPPRYIVTLPFAHTLYKWRFRMAPREVPALLARASNRRAADGILIFLSAATVFVGLLILTLAVRAERRASRLKSVFIANVSHELKTPLSLIRMFGEMLASGRAKDAATAKEYAEIITRESDRLGHLIDNVLDFSRIERGHAAFRLVPSDLGELTARAMDLCRHRVEKEGMKLVLSCPETLPPVRLDEDAFTLVLLNLVDNAVKYAASGKELAVRLEAVEDWVEIRFSDRGPGIPAEEHGRIFERFYRGRSVRGQPVRGSGIGLSLVKHIVHAHGGEVEVESRLGEGTTFIVSLPVAREAGAADAGGPA